MTPRFSVFTPTRDRPEWLPYAIRSVQQQTFKDYEHVIFDNGAESVEHLIPDDPRIRYCRGESDGMHDSWNRTLALCKGEIVHPFSDDDRLKPDALETVDTAIGDAQWLTAQTVIVNKLGMPKQVLGGPLDLDRLRQGYYLGGAIFWRRELTDRLGAFDLAYDGAADYDLYLRFAKDSTPVFVPKVLYEYTDHPGTDSHVREANQMEATARIKAAA